MPDRGAVRRARRRSGRGADPRTTAATAAAAAASFCALLVAAPALSGPFAPPGDARLRADAELLHAAGLLPEPLDSWPAAWRQIDAALARAEGRPLAPHVAAAVSRLRAASARKTRPHRLELRLTGATEPPLLRGFAAAPRSAGEAVLLGEGEVGPLTLALGATWEGEGTPRRPETLRGTGLSARPSAVSLALGNLGLYAGYVDVWWGPGQEAALIWSTSARAFPKVGAKLLEPRRIDVPVLRWLGPVRGEAFVGLLDETRDYDNPMVIGMRAEARPLRGLAVGLQRGMMLCGRDRPCGVGTIAKSLFGALGVDNTGTFDEPGNQLAGFDIAWTAPLLQTAHALRLHMTVVGEDSTNVLGQLSRQAGLRLFGPVGETGASYLVALEVTDTAAATFLGTRRFPGSMYNHFIYTDGWTYQRRPLGASFDGESRLVSLAGELVDTRNRRLWGSVQLLDLSVTADGRYRLSATRERIGLAAAGAEVATRLGRGRAAIRVQRNAPNTPDSRPTRLDGEISWILQF